MPLDCPGDDPYCPCQDGTGQCMYDHHQLEGTAAGYAWHRRHHTEPCDPCKHAHAEYYAQWLTTHIEQERARWRANSRRYRANKKALAS